MIFKRGGKQQEGVRNPAPLPPAVTVLVRPDVLQAVATASASAGDVETGGPLIGTVQRSWEPVRERLIVSVLASVPPGPGTQGRISSVALGECNEGERASSALRWWRSVTGLDLVHLGDWHRHPSGSCEPSQLDLETACEMRTESDAPVWLVAIAVGTGNRQVDVAIDGNLARLSTRSECSDVVAFYQELGRNELTAARIRVESAALPRLPALPWHVADPVRFAAECRLLAAAGFKLSLGSAEGKTGLRLRVERDDRNVTISTGPGYPDQKPRLVNERHGQVVGPGWSRDRFLVDLVREVC